MRRTLANHRKQPKEINMEQVYDLLDSGKTVNEAAALMGCSRSTLYRRHKEYQAELEAENKVDPVDEWIAEREKKWNEENPFDD